VVEYLIGEPNLGLEGKLMDLNMMVITGGGKNARGICRDFPSSGIPTCAGRAHAYADRRDRGICGRVNFANLFFA